MSARNQQPGSPTFALTAPHRVKLVRYFFVGAAGTAVHYVLLFLLLDELGAVTASTVGAVAGGLTNFVLAHAWVFSGRASVRRALPRFAVVAAACLGVNAAILSLMILSLPVLPAQLVATGSAFLAGYVLNDLWSFRELT